MPTLPQYRETHYLYSGKVSDICRQLSFAAIAIIWIFKTEASGVLVVPKALVLPAVLAVLALACDLLQYLVGSATWYLVYRHHEKINTPENVELRHSVWLVLPINFFFYAKVAFVAATYYFVLVFLIGKLNAGF